MTLPHHHPHKIEVSVSILRLSAAERLAVSGAVIVLLWGAILWAMS